MRCKVKVQIAAKDRKVGAMVKALAVEVSGFQAVAGTTKEHLAQTGAFIFRFPSKERADAFKAAVTRYVPTYAQVADSTDGPLSVVYFIEDAGRNIKIGHSANQASRLEQLRAGSSRQQLIGTVPGGREMEKLLHARFKADRIEGRREWFRRSYDLENFLKEEFGLETRT